MGAILRHMYLGVRSTSLLQAVNVSARFRISNRTADWLPLNAFVGQGVGAIGQDSDRLFETTN
jgi:hypothetical protein